MAQPPQVDVDDDRNNPNQRESQSGVVTEKIVTESQVPGASINKTPRIESIRRDRNQPVEAQYR
jgi:hypothetical protein